MMSLAGTCTCAGFVGRPPVTSGMGRGLSWLGGEACALSSRDRHCGGTYQRGRGLTTEAPRGGRTAPTGRMNGKGS